MESDLRKPLDLYRSASSSKLEEADPCTQMEEEEEKKKEEEEEERNREREKHRYKE